MSVCNKNCYSSPKEAYACGKREEVTIIVNRVSSFAFVISLFVWFMCAQKRLIKIQNGNCNLIRFFENGNGVKRDVASSPSIGFTLFHWLSPHGYHI